MNFPSTDVSTTCKLSPEMNNQPSGADGTASLGTLAVSEDLKGAHSPNGRHQTLVGQFRKKWPPGVSTGPASLIQSCLHQTIVFWANNETDSGHQSGNWVGSPEPCSRALGWLVGWSGLTQSCLQRDRDRVVSNSKETGTKIQGGGGRGRLRLYLALHCISITTKMTHELI